MAIRKYCGTQLYVFHSGGVMIYFDRIEVVNMLVPSAGKSLILALIFFLIRGYFVLFMHFICLLFSNWHSEELHCRLWQDSHLQQNSPWAEPVLQRTHTAGGLYRAVRWVTDVSNSLFCPVFKEQFLQTNFSFFVHKLLSLIYGNFSQT